MLVPEFRFTFLGHRAFFLPVHILLLCSAFFFLLACLSISVTLISPGWFGCTCFVVLLRGWITIFTSRRDGKQKKRPMMLPTAGLKG
ncbi:hypothetical protein BDV34DRAFT_95452 [Aspergillus parasiticus]|uniref:Uncharacterized protein n=1 Tax=Aspergillus parasiticus TaxID=5067 RepID=A0A5N6DLB0_ASPPA|nr:hypothetical protein BDV34DRAFT_95452 [Aspergillus parasiticus]